MMLKTQNRCAKNTLLPFNLTKGNVKERGKKAWEYWNRFVDNILQNKELTVDIFKSSLDDVLKPHKINYDILKEKKLTEYGHVGAKILLLPHPNGGLYIERIGYKIVLPISSKDNCSIYNATTAVHEAKHFFNYLFQSKYACIKAKELVNNPSCENYVDKLRDVVFNDFSTRFNKRNFTQKVEYLLNKLPDNVAIESLQKLRYSLKSENEAMSAEIKYLAKQNPIKNIPQILLTFELRQFCRYRTKEKIVTSKLKELLLKVRNDLKQRLNAEKANGK